MKIKRKIVSQLKQIINNIFDDHFASMIFIVGTYWILTDAIWTVITIIDYYFNKQLLANNNFLWFFVIVLPIVITIAYSKTANKLKKYKTEAKESKTGLKINIDNLRFQRNIIAESLDTIFQHKPEALEKEIKTAIDNKDWAHAIKIGKHGARLFLMFEKYDLRIEYGNYIITAAIENKSIEDEAMGYIDCVGWSLVKKGDYNTGPEKTELYNKAKDNIKIGLNKLIKLKSENSYILQCKAYRHLIGIALRESDLNEAQLKREDFYNALQKLKGINKKTMQASLKMIDGDIASKKTVKDYPKTIELYESARELYESCSDYERAVKLYNKIGEVHMESNEDHKAIKNFLIGFWKSEKLGRDDEKFKNCKKIVELIDKNNNILNEIHNDEFKKELEEFGISKIRDNQFYIKEKEDMKKRIHP